MLGKIFGWAIPSPRTLKIDASYVSGKTLIITTYYSYFIHTDVHNYTQIGFWNMKFSLVQLFSWRNRIFFGELCYSPKNTYDGLGKYSVKNWRYFLVKNFILKNWSLKIVARGNIYFRVSHGLDIVNSSINPKCVVVHRIPPPYLCKVSNLKEV